MCIIIKLTSILNYILTLLFNLKTLNNRNNQTKIISRIWELYIYMGSSVFQFDSFPNSVRKPKQHFPLI